MSKYLWSVVELLRGPKPDKTLDKVFEAQEEERAREEEKAHETAFLLHAEGASMHSKSE